jgi:F1F0 ATPase subunit 2
MSESLIVLLSLAGGGLIGTVFFGGLWMTTRRVLHSRHPAVLSLASFLGRTLISSAGFYLIARQGDWRAVVAAALGFLAARFAATALTRRAHER